MAQVLFQFPSALALLKELQKVQYILKTTKCFIHHFVLGNDFEISDPVQLVLGSGTTSTCTDIATIHDEVYEDTESFTATLYTTNGDVTVTIDSATILITDNDGGCLSVVICVHT